MRSGIGLLSIDLPEDLTRAIGPSDQGSPSDHFLHNAADWQTEQSEIDRALGLTEHLPTRDEKCRESGKELHDRPPTARDLKQPVHPRQLFHISMIREERRLKKTLDVYYNVYMTGRGELLQAWQYVPDGGYRWVVGREHPENGKIRFATPSTGPIDQTAWLATAPSADYLIADEGSKGHKRRVPAEDLCQLFAALPAEKDAIRSFANTHGWLGHDTKKVFSDMVDYTRIPNLLGISHPAVPAAQTKIERFLGKPLVTAEGFYQWQQEIAEFRTFYELHDRVLRNDRAYLKERLRFDPRHGVTFLSQQHGMPIGLRIEIEDAGDVLTRFSTRDLREPARAVIIKKINLKLKDGIAYGLWFVNQAKQAPYIASRAIAKHLLAAIWLQFSQYLNGERTLKPCQICGELMDITGDVRKAARRMHSNCSKKERMRRYRDRQRREGSSD